MANQFDTGKFQLSPADLSYRDVSTVRRALNVHEDVVVAAWRQREYLAKVLIASSTVVDQALSKAGEK
jgi:hypothetical protein